MDNLSNLLRESAPAGSYAFAWFKQAVNGWLIAGSVEGWSERTRTDRRAWIDRLSDFLQYHELDFSTDSIRAFLLALQEGTELRCRKPLRPGSLDHAHRLLRAFCQWLVDEELCPAHLMKRIPPPINRDDRARPFTEDEVKRLMAAAKRTRAPERDYALLSVLLDTGLRVSELCALRMADADLLTGTLAVQNGKGGKSRQAPIGRDAVKALWHYLKCEHQNSTDPLFMSQRGEPLDDSAVRQLLTRLGKQTKIHAHPHKFRHTAAVFMLRNGASAYHVMRFLGHTTLSTTQRYAKLAENDVLEVHRTTSPLDNLRLHRNSKRR